MEGTNEASIRIWLFFAWNSADMSEIIFQISEFLSSILVVLEN